jgi:ABC-2 type transport system ATP-binding protein
MAVYDFSMSVKKGTIHGLLGPNAAGKTTAIKMMIGKLKPDSGKVFTLDREMPKGFSKIANKVGVMPQGQALYGDLTVQQNLRFFTSMQDLRGKEADFSIKKLIELMRLEKEISKSVYSLSGGTKQRLSLACTLIHSPQLLFLDEPTVGIDPVLRHIFWDYFKKVRNQGTTILLTTHYIQEAENCDTVSLIREGQLIEEGTPKELMQRYDSQTLEEVFVKISEGDADD